MSKDFISDSEMMEIESTGAQKSGAESPDFISDDDMSKMSNPSTSAGMAAIESFGNNATLGYLPHLQAITEKIMPDPNAALDARLRAEGFNIEQEEPTYIKSRDANIARQDLQKKEHPYAAGAGTIAGTLATIVGTGGLGAVAKGASGAQRLAAGVRAGGILGAASNPGDAAGELDLLQVGDRGRNAALGAAFGGGGQLLAEGAGVVSEKASKALKNYAGKKAFRALGREAVKKSEALAKSGRDVEIGRELLDEGAIPVFGSTSRIAKRVSTAKDAADDVIGDILEKSGGGAKVFDAEKAAIQLLDHPELALMRKTPGMEGAVRTIEDAAETLAKNGKLTLEEANQLKRAIDRSINFNKKIPEMQGKQEGLFKARTAVRDEMNTRVNELAPGQKKDALLSANRKSGNLATAEEILEKELGREQRNRMVGLTDTIAAAGGFAVGNTPEEKAIYGLLLGALNKGGRKFGNSIQARGANALAGQLSKLPRFSAMAEKNPAGFAAAVERAAERLGIGGGGVLQPQYAQKEADRGVAREMPKGGPDRWAQSGAQKLGIDAKTAEQLLNSKAGKQILIEASDLSPNSPKLNRIKDQIQKGWGSR